VFHDLDDLEICHLMRTFIEFYWRYEISKTSHFFFDDMFCFHDFSYLIGDVIHVFFFHVMIFYLMGIWIGFECFFSMEIFHGM